MVVPPQELKPSSISITVYIQGHLLRYGTFPVQYPFFYQTSGGYHDRYLPGFESVKMDLQPVVLLESQNVHTPFLIKPQEVITLDICRVSRVKMHKSPVPQLLIHQGRLFVFKETHGDINLGEPRVTGFQPLGKVIDNVDSCFQQSKTWGKKTNITKGGKLWISTLTLKKSLVFSIYHPTCCGSWDIVMDGLLKMSDPLNPSED